MEILPAQPPVTQGFALNEPTQPGRDLARVTELYRERYGDPDELDLERLSRAAAWPALIPVTPVEALGHVCELVLAVGGSMPCLVCWVLHRRQHHPTLDRTHAYTPMIRGA